MTQKDEIACPYSDVSNYYRRLFCSHLSQGQTRKQSKCLGRGIWSNSIIVVVFLFQNISGMKEEETVIGVLSMSFPQGSAGVSHGFREPITLGLTDSNHFCIFLEILVF